MEKSEEIINEAIQRFKELEHKKLDWRSFYTGYLEAQAEQLALLRVTCSCKPIMQTWEKINNKWTHIVMVSDGEIQYTYVNGKFAKKEPLPNQNYTPIDLYNKGL